jgi:hypothetical protein
VSSLCIIGMVIAFVVGGTIGIAAMALLSFARDPDNDHE